jgi:glycosyltransferase involved in cell wall biosynthesis
MHLLVVSQYFWPENFRINDLVEELIKRGHRVTILTGKPSYPLGKIYPNYRKDPHAFSEFKGAKIVRVPMLVRGQGSFRLFLNYVSFVVGASFFGPWYLRGENIDAIFVFEPSPITVCLPAILIGRLKNAPVTLWVLDLWPDTLSAIGAVHSPYLLKLIGVLVRFIYERCTIILGQSNSFLSSIASYCSNPTKIHYFPAWAEDIFRATLKVKAHEIPVQNKKFNILFAGNIGEAQDMPAIVDAAELLKSSELVRWLIVGDGRKSAWLEEQVNHRGLQREILLLGRHEIERMPEFYAHANALLVSLKRDPVFSMTIPGKVQSYLLSGIPIIGMLDGEGAHVIKKARAGLTCPAGDSAGLVEVIQKMVSMPLEQRALLGSNGRAYAKTEFDRNVLIDRLEYWLVESIKVYRQKSGMKT